jgi:hypothetical protein
MSFESFDQSAKMWYQVSSHFFSTLALSPESPTELFYQEIDFIEICSRQAAAITTNRIIKHLHYQCAFKLLVMSIFNTDYTASMSLVQFLLVNFRI